jgi:hypothetical protein
MSEKVDRNRLAVKYARHDVLDSSSASFRSTLIAAKVKFQDDPQHLAHIERWLGSADDPIWRSIVKKIIMNSDHPRPQELIEPNYWWIVYTGLHARMAAEHAAATGRDLRFEQARDFKLQYLKLADAAEMLAQDFTQRPSEFYRKLARVLKEEAVHYRQNAAKIKRPPSLRISRQAGGKKRPQFRLYSTFMSYVITLMRQNLGGPNYPAVVAMTDVAFPEADVSEEDARAVWRAMAGSRRSGPKPVHSATN